MSRYRSTLDLWNASTIAALRSGLIRIQCGQWVQCGPGAKSRYISHMEHGTFNVAHGHTPKATNLAFNRRVDAARQQRARL